MKTKVSDVLFTGAENAITARQLREILNCSQEDLRYAIAKERRQGSPICSSTNKTHGYFLAANKDEMKRYCQSLRHRAGEIFATRAACLKMIDSLPSIEEVTNHDQ